MDVSIRLSGGSPARIPPMTSYQARALYLARLEQEDATRYYELTSLLRSATPSPESRRSRRSTCSRSPVATGNDNCPIHSDPIEEATDGEDGRSDRIIEETEEIEDWSDSSIEEDYGWARIFSGTPERRALNELCERVEREESVLVSGAATPNERALTPVGDGSDVSIRAICDQWIKIRNGLDDRTERIKRLVDYLRDFRDYACQTEKQYAQLKAMMQKYELGREDSLLLPLKRKRRYGLNVGKRVNDVNPSKGPPTTLGLCLKCDQTHPSAEGTSKVGRCPPCELNLKPRQGSDMSERNVTARYRKFRGCPYKHPEDISKDGGIKSLLYRKRQKPFYDYRSASKKEIIRVMKQHAQYRRMLKLQRKRRLERLIMKWLWSPFK